MQLLTNGEPTVHRHHATRTPAGSVMTEAELRDFAVSALISEYQSVGDSVSPYPKEQAGDPDFCLAYGGQLVYVLVACHRDAEVARASVDSRRMLELYRETGALPRLIISSHYCFDGGDEGLSAIAGGSFCFRHTPMSLLPLPEELPESSLTHDQLVERYEQMWQTRDADALADCLHPHVFYHSKRIYDEVPSREEYLAFLKYKFGNIEKMDSQIEVGQYWDADLQQAGVLLIQDGRHVCLKISTESGYITRIQLFTPDSEQPTKDSEEDGDEDEIEQTVGARIACLIEPEIYLREHLPTTLYEGTPAYASQQQCRFNDEGKPALTNIISTRYGAGALGMLHLLAEENQGTSLLFVSCYPHAQGRAYQAIVESVYEWENMLEALVTCSFGRFTCCFFATDYHAHKQQYCVGDEICVELSALLSKRSEPELEMVIEPEKAEHFLQMTGMEPDYNEQGEIMPLRIGMREMVMCIPSNHYYPDKAAFQSPASNYSELSLLGVEMLQCEVKIHQEPDLCIPLYLRKSLLPDPESQPEILRGQIFIQGQLRQPRG